MGITGLLPYLAQATKPCHISEFRGGTVAVDTYCLLHRGANACAEELARGEDSQLYVDYCLKYVKMLLSYDIHPIMIFDGRNLPAKAETEAKRRESRKKAKQRAAELLKLGRTDEARTYLKQCIDITPKMAHNLIRECRKLHVDCLVAPYESDAQLAFFSNKGIADCIITEDSDLVLFGCKRVMYKLDLNGSGRLVESDKISAAMKMRPDQFTFEKFRFMCILSGCDYVSNLNGIGLKKAEKFLKLTSETDPELFIDRIPRYLNMKHLVVTEEYKRSVLIANATFLHQIVFDPFKKELVHLTDPGVIGTNPEYLINAGEKFDGEKAFQVALGNVDPYSFEEYDSWSPSDETLPQYSIWSGVCKKRVSRKEQKIRLQDAMKRATFAMKPSKAEEERWTAEEESRIATDLSLYTKKRPANKAIETKSETEECEVVKSEDNIPSTEKRNPFLINKKISKFPKTYTYGSSVVKSRFFFASIKHETPESLPKNEHSIDENIAAEQSNSVEETSVEPSEINSPRVSSDEVLKSCENTIEPHSAEKILGNDCKNIENITEIIDTDSKETVIEKSVQETEEHVAKRIKLGPCRTLGLRKKPSGQKTLLNYFEKLKKSE